MKKLIFLLMAFSLTACCVGQLPTQYVYVGDSCEVPLPDYRSQVTVRDNCDIVTLEQIPLPGLIMDSGNPYKNVVIEATDISGNKSTINFDVIIMDTTPPEIVFDTLIASHYTHWSETLTRYQTDVINNIDQALENFPDTLGLSDSLYVDMNLLTVSAANLVGKHWSTFYPKDLILMPVDSLQLDSLGYTVYKLPIHVVK